MEIGRFDQCNNDLSVNVIMQVHSLFAHVLCSLHTQQLCFIMIDQLKRHNGLFSS